MQDEQAEVVAFLRAAVARLGGAPVQVVETHGAFIFLAGTLALKMKRAVRYDYMDLTTLSQREVMLRRELELNRPAAPEIYIDVLPVTREPAGGLALGGAGAPVEWVLRMRRFPAEAELSAIAAAGGITETLAADLGRSIAAYHAAAPLRQADGAALIAAILQELDDAFAGMDTALGAARIAGFRPAHATLDAVAPLLRRRGAEGHVRRCHGDLHLRNIVMIGDRPVPFDALEFDETLGTCDMLYDLAFLIMDLRHLSLDKAANIVLGSYLLAAGGAQDEGLAALPLFLAVRAAILAMVTVQTDRARGSPGRSDDVARAYLDHAGSLLAPPPPSLVAVGGLSGSGKTALARDIAPAIGAAPGAVHLRSDLERKAMLALPDTARLPASQYSAEARAEVYARMLARAGTILCAGHAVVLDATWLDAEARAAAARLAAEVGVPFRPLWLEAPAEVLYARIAARRGDASDADAAVLAAQIVADAAPADWPRVDAGGDPESVLQAAMALL